MTVSCIRAVHIWTNHLDAAHSGATKTGYPLWMNKRLPHMQMGLLLLVTACTAPASSNDADTTGTPTDPDTVPEPEPVPIDCPGIDEHTGVLRPLNAAAPETVLASFPLSVPALAVIDDTIWLLAQMFQDEASHCDVIGMAALQDLPSSEPYPLTPLVIHDAPELGLPNPDADAPFPPADPSVISVTGRDEVVMLTTLRLVEQPQEPCIALSVARDPAEPTQGFDYLEATLWCEPAVHLMDAAGWFDPETSLLHVVMSDFGAGPDQITNWHAEFDLSGDTDTWRFIDAAISPFSDFHLLGTFDTTSPDCPGPIFYGTTNEPGRTGVQAACFEPSTKRFSPTGLFISDVRDPAVATDPDTLDQWLVYSAH